MSSRALARTRIALGALMATATLATIGLAGTLALSRNQASSDTADTAVEGRTTPASTTHRTGHQRPTSNSQTFAPTTTPSATTGTSHTKTKGS